MDDPDFVLVVESNPICHVPAQTEPLCSLWAWSQAFGVPVTLIPGGCRMGESRLKARVTRQGGQPYAPVTELAAGLGLKVAIDPVLRRVHLWKPHWKRPGAPSPSSALSGEGTGAVRPREAPVGSRCRKRGHQLDEERAKGAGS